MLDALAGLAVGAKIGTEAHKNNVSPGVAMLGILAAGKALEMASNSGGNQVLTFSANDAAEAIAQQRVISDLINNSGYKLLNMQYVGETGRVWTLAKR